MAKLCDKYDVINENNMFFHWKIIDRFDKKTIDDIPEECPIYMEATYDIIIDCGY